MAEAIELLTSPPFLATLFTAIAAFATVLSLVTPFLARDQLNQRMRVMATERSKLRAQRLQELTRDKKDSKRLRDTPGSFLSQLADKLNLRSQIDNEDLRSKLKMAGLRGQGPILAYLVFRVAAPPGVFILTALYLFFVNDFGYTPNGRLLIASIAGGLGYYLPALFIQNLAQKRQQAIKSSFPDALDMLLICVQSGMSVEAGFGKVASEIGPQCVELGEELSLTTAELAFLPERRMAYENLSQRTGLPGVKAVCTALIQAERYGTAVSTALRTMAKETRDMRMADAERKAAALPPKLTVPMIIFFLPVLFIIILGPAAISYWKMD